MALSQPSTSSPASSPVSPFAQPADATHDERPGSSGSCSELPTSFSPQLTPFTPSADTERHPKGKRKRTTIKDKSILESAYAENPKPDKAARLAIVDRVSLNEKEVQIWFQNRRQNDRRKARPLSSQELAALRYGSMQILSSDPAPFNSSFGSDMSQTSPLQPVSRTERAVASPPLSDPASFCDEVNTAVHDLPSETWLEREPEVVEVHESRTPAPKRGNGADNADHRRMSCSSSVDLSMGWSVGKLSTPACSGQRGGYDFFSFPSFPPPNVSSPLRARPVLPRPEHTKYRISLSLDGKAGVVSTIPSPPRAVMPPPSFNDIQSSATIRRFGLQRSQSASSPVTLPPLSLLTNSLSPRADNRTYPQPPPLRRGRSRDVHAWESCADMETREDTLTEQAKHESNGSAIAAISLLRSTSSSGSPLQPSNSTKRNAAMARTTPRPDQTKKPRLTTVLGSAIKLQCDFDLMEKRSGEKEIANTEKSKLVLSGNDSDKENWSPGEDGSPRFSFSRTQRDASLAGRRPLPTGTAGPDRKPRRTPARNAQGEIGPLLSRANTVPANMWAQRGGKSIQPPLKIFEDARESGSAPTGADDDEVERFMRGEVSPSKKGDVDAVAGLLSLSQGNWR